MAPLLLAALALGFPGITVAQGPAGVNRAGLVIQLGDNQSITHCIAFDEESITGMDLLERSGLPLAIDRSHALGAIVCSIDAEGCSFPGEACFCQCQGTPCHYWNYYYLTNSGWQYGHLGATTRTLTDGDVDAWVWGDTRSSHDKLPDIGFDDICSQVAVAAVTATPSTPAADSVLGNQPTVATPVVTAPSDTAKADVPAPLTATSAAPTAPPESDATGQPATRLPESRAETPSESSGTPICSGPLALGLAIGSMAAIGLVAVRGRQRPERRPEPVEGQRR